MWLVIRIEVMLVIYVICRLKKQSVVQSSFLYRVSLSFFAKDALLCFQSQLDSWKRRILHFSDTFSLMKSYFFEHNYQRHRKLPKYHNQNRRVALTLSIRTNIRLNQPSPTGPSRKFVLTAEILSAHQFYTIIKSNLTTGTAFEVD